MTALKDFERLECPGIWRASEKAQRINVIVSVGEATLTMADRQESAIAHWSLPAVQRLNPDVTPALYSPGPDSSESLEINDQTMINAIAKVHSAIERRRPHPGRLRVGLFVGVSILMLAVVVFWLPRAMVDYTASVVPASKRAAIGQDLLTNISRISGTTCDDALGKQALAKLQSRLFPGSATRIEILPAGVKKSQHLPGGIILLNRSLVEDHEEVGVAAGYALIEDERASQSDPLLRMLRQTGLSASFRLLTTGNISSDSLTEYAEFLLTSQPVPVSENQIISRFQSLSIRLTPYAYAVDISGETTVRLIEADATLSKSAAPLLDDANWVSLQQICGG